MLRELQEDKARQVTGSRSRKKLIAAFGSRPPNEGRAVALRAETNRAGTTDVAGPGFPSADLATCSTVIHFVGGLFTCCC